MNEQIDIGKSKAIREPTYETLLLFKYLEKIEKGTNVLYSSLTKIIGMDVTMNPGRGYLTTARRMVQREKGYVFLALKGPDRGKGLRCLTDEENVQEAGNYAEEVRRKAKRNDGKLACADLDNVTEDGKMKYNLFRTLLSIVHEAGKRKRLLQIENKIKETGQRLPVGKVLELLHNKTAPTHPGLEA